MITLSGSAHLDNPHLRIGCLNGTIRGTTISYPITWPNQGLPQTSCAVKETQADPMSSDPEANLDTKWCLGLGNYQGSGTLQGAEWGSYNQPRRHSS